MAINTHIPAPDQIGEEALRQRIAELEHKLAQAQQIEAGLRQKTSEQETLLNAIPALVFFKDRDHRYRTINQAYAASYSLTIADIVGKNDFEIHAPEIAAAYQSNDEAVMASGQAKLNVELPIKLADGSDGWLSEQNIPHRDSDGNIVGMVGVAVDVTERKRAEEALRRSEAQLRELVSHQERLIETIRVLSTPLMPIRPGLLALPLVGHLDTARGQQVMEAMLEGVQRFQAEFIIIDITGVPVIDTAVANYVLQAAQAVSLLGAQCVLVGISPEIAQTLVQLGVNLSTLATQRDLQAGIAYAMARLRNPVLA